MRISGIDGTLFGRRDFLKVAVGAAAGVGVSGCRVFSSAHSATWERVRAEALRQVADGLTLCAAVGSTAEDDPVYVGRMGPGADAAPVDGTTRFDLASLTKTITASVCATLVTEGRLDPDAPFTEYFPEHALGKSCAITVRDLATHASGFGNFSGSRYSEDPKVHRGAVGFEEELRSKLPRRPRGTYCYSCYNYALLGTVAERAGGCPLDRLAAERVFGPLGMDETAWWPVADDGRTVTVPLPMRDGRLRKTGEVHDEVARYAGRPIGNAGVFSTLPDMMRFATDLLERRRFPAAHYKLLFDGTFRLDRECRSFGFDMGANGRPAWASERSIRHTGFTGQLILVDPERSFAGVTLTLRRPKAAGTLGARHRLLELCLPVASGAKTDERGEGDFAIIRP